MTAPSAVQPVATWQDDLRRIEDLGFDTVVLADHFTGGWSIEPMVGLTAAALSTTSLRVQTGVLGNDYRHPVLVHRMAALLDVLSEGRLTLGLGAGWLTSDYAAAGIPYDPPGDRVSRLEEAITILKGLFADGPCSYVGNAYQVHELDGLPKPMQRPHPPLLIGGGGRRMLRLAGKEADIAGINANLRAGELGRHAVVDLALERVAEKVAWVHDGARGAGRDPGAVELEMNHWLVRVTSTRDEADAYLAGIAARYEVDPARLAASPSVLVGTVGQCVDTLLARRDALGFSFLQLDAGFPPADLGVLAPLVAALAGQ